MDIHEYQAKELLKKFGVNVPRGGIAYSPEQAVYRAQELSGDKCVVKAQIHSGARGKAGGVRVCSSDDEISEAAGEPMLSVLMPTSPMPMTGFTVTIRRSEAIDLDLTVDEAIQFVVSCGVVVPPQQRTDVVPATAAPAAPVAPTATGGSGTSPATMG